MDLRVPAQKHSYFAPNPDSNDLLDRGHSFIPVPWSNMSRYAEQTVPVEGLLSDFLEFAIGEGYTAPVGYMFDSRYQTAGSWSDYIRDAAESDWEDPRRKLDV